MRIFVSYARADGPHLEGLVDDLERAGHTALVDRTIAGWRPWWEAILADISGCDAFVFLVSPNSIASEACQAELGYATAVRRPILPVIIAPTDLDLAPDAIGATQAVDHLERTSASTIDLLVALTSLPPAPRLPDPLPVAPEPPITDIGPLRDRLADRELAPSEQRQLLDEFRARTVEVDQADTLRELLLTFRRRNDVVESVGHEIDGLIRSLPVTDTGDRPRDRPASQRDPDSVDRLRALLAYVRSGTFTPILGHGLNDSIIGSTRRLALEWSQSFEFPMAEHRHGALADVAQFITVTTNVDTLRLSIVDYLLKHIERRHPGSVDNDDPELAGAMEAAWRASRTDSDPYVVLAELPCPVYVVAQPWSLLSTALREAGRDPVVEICRWRPDVYDWPESVFDTEPGYTPTPERPLVFHVYGTLDFPDSIVLTQDDFDEFMIAVAENRTLIPSTVQMVLANSAIMMLGFDLDDRDVRVLLRSLIAQQGAQKLSRFSHVAAQLEYDSAVAAPDRARRYLERYFSKYHEPSIDLFWGTVNEFSADLADLWRKTGE